MRVLQVSYCDLPGRIFDGYNLQESLNEKGFYAKQVVIDKTACDEGSISLCSSRELEIRSKLIEMEREYGMFNLLEPFHRRITDMPYFKEADIVHYHIIHLYMLSLLSLNDLFTRKPSVWTFHDPWPLTGRCVHPLSCGQWKNGCLKCQKTNEAAFPTKTNKEADLWKIKYKIFEKVKDKVDIVVASDWMLERVKSSPITSQVKHIHKIPFGIIAENYKKYNKFQAKQKLKIPTSNTVISFRSEEDPLKGTSYIVEALERLQDRQNITILTVGHMKLPEHLRNMFHVIELGWQQQEGVELFLGATDIFVMPSLAESFGLMAIEAMASKCTVIMFKGTALEKVTFSPECGFAVGYQDVEELRQALEYLLLHPEERKRRGEKGRELVCDNYRYEQYLSKHIELYDEILSRKITRESKTVQFEENHVWKLEEEMDRMNQFKKELLKNINAEKPQIAIYANSNEGIEIYKLLTERLVSVQYLIGCCQWGSIVTDKTVKQVNSIREIPNLQSTIILMEGPSDLLTEEINGLSVGGLIEKKDLEYLLKKYPPMYPLSQFRKIPDLDYSDKGVEKLIQLFNQTVEDICMYYEEKIENHINQ